MRQQSSVVRGSSPLARGAPRIDSALYFPVRLIPAGAGSTTSVGVCGVRRGLIPAGAGSTDAVTFDDALAEAHPRWRGEHFLTNISRCQS